MTIGFTLSNELADYGAELRAWGTAEVRPHARQADIDHVLPENAAKIMDTCPVRLGRPGRSNDVASTFADGPGIYGLVFYENLAYGDIWAFEALNNGIAHYVVEAIGTPEQVSRWYTPIVKVGGKTAFGMSEPGVGSDTSRVETTAKRDGDSWIINGTKMYCSLGADAEYVLVFASTDKSLGRRGIQAFVVDKGTAGLHVVRRNEDKLGLRCWLTSQMAFDDCRIPADHLLGWSPSADAAGATGDQKSQAAGLSRLNFNRPNVSALAIGLAQAAMDVTFPLLREQRAAFAPHRWGVVESEMEQMTVMLKRCRLMNYRAKALEDIGEHDNRIEASMAKAYAPPIAERIIRRCMLLLGPDGVSTELLLEKWYRDVKILDIFEGTGQIMRVLISRGLMGKAAG